MEENGLTKPMHTANNAVLSIEWLKSTLNLTVFFLSDSEGNIHDYVFFFFLCLAYIYSGQFAGTGVSEYTVERKINFLPCYSIYPVYIA